MRVQQSVNEPEPAPEEEAGLGLGFRLNGLSAVRLQSSAVSLITDP
jgi:hypothetical protein